MLYMRSLSQIVVVWSEQPRDAIRPPSTPPVPFPPHKLANGLGRLEQHNHQNFMNEHIHMPSFSSTPSHTPIPRYDIPRSHEPYRIETTHKKIRFGLNSVSISKTIPKVYRDTFAPAAVLESFQRARGSHGLYCDSLPELATNFWDRHSYGSL